MFGVQFENFLVHLLCFLTVTFFLIDNGQIKKRCWVVLLVYGYLQVVNRLVKIFAQLVVEYAEVEVGLKIFRVKSKCPLVQTLALLEHFSRIVARFL